MVDNLGMALLDYLFSAPYGVGHIHLYLCSQLDADWSWMASLMCLVVGWSDGETGPCISHHLADQFGLLHNEAGFQKQQERIRTNTYTF